MSLDDLEAAQDLCEDCGISEASYQCEICGKKLCEDCACWTEDGVCVCEDCSEEEDES